MSMETMKSLKTGKMKWKKSMIRGSGTLDSIKSKRTQGKCCDSWIFQRNTRTKLTSLEGLGFTIPAKSFKMIIWSLKQSSTKMCRMKISWMSGTWIWPDSRIESKHRASSLTKNSIGNKRVTDLSMAGCLLKPKNNSTVPITLVPQLKIYRWSMGSCQSASKQSFTRSTFTGRKCTRDWERLTWGRPWRWRWCTLLNSRSKTMVLIYNTWPRETRDFVWRNSSQMVKMALTKVRKTTER